MLPLQDLVMKNVQFCLETGSFISNKYFLEKNLMVTTNFQSCHDLPL